MVLKAILIVAVFAILMEDGLSIKKRTREEEEEDERIEAEVNRTLAEEEKKKEEDERKKRDERKKKEDESKTSGLEEKKKTQGGEKAGVEEQEGQGEACPACNSTCQEIPACLPCLECPEIEPCPKVQPCKECPPCEECGPCPGVKPCRPCKPCGPCPSFNKTSVPESGGCPEAELGGMPTLVAMAIGAVATLLLTGVAAALGLLLRYASPLESGFVFLATIIIMWYLCSRYPEAARELGERVVATLRDATIALGHREAEAIQRHSNQVGFPNSFSPNLSYKFNLKEKCLH
jgi:hypothetical protein